MAGEAAESFPKPRKGSGFSFRAEGEKEFMAFRGFAFLNFHFRFHFFETCPDLTSVCRLVGDTAAYLEFGSSPKRGYSFQFSADVTRQPDSVSPRVVIGQNRKHLEKSQHKRRNSL
jgi:hypothetical protein